MYSVVVLAALSAGVASPDWGCGYGGYSSCSSYGSYCGSSYGGCGYSYGGCGYSYGGCGYGSGGYCGYSSHCYSPSYSYCYSPSYSHCYYPTYSYCYTPTYYSPCYPVVPYQKDIKKDTKKGGTGKGGDGLEDGQVSTTAPATLVVNLPADATLTIDGTPTTSTSSRRVFITPELDKGKKYQYTLKATAMRDGKPVQIEEPVIIRPGEESQVTLKLPATSVAAR